MRTMSLTMALFLGAAPLCWGQPRPSTIAMPPRVATDERLLQAPPLPPAAMSGTTVSTGGTTGRTLEELLGQALKSNPDVRVAESKLREAEAELARVRMQIMQKVVKLEFELKDAREKVARLTRQHERMQQLLKTKVLSQQEFDVSEAELQAAKSALARFEGELPFLLGKQPQFEEIGLFLELGNYKTGGTGAPLQITLPMKTSIAPPATAPASASATDKLRKALDAPISLHYKDQIIEDVLQDLRRAAKGLNFLVNAKDVNKDLRLSVDITQPITIGAALQWLEDQTGLRFVLREYGIVGVPQNTLPPGAVGVVELWRTAQRSGDF